MIPGSMDPASWSQASCAVSYFDLEDFVHLPNSWFVHSQYFRHRSHRPDGDRESGKLRTKRSEGTIIKLSQAREFLDQSWTRMYLTC